MHRYLTCSAESLAPPAARITDRQESPCATPETSSSRSPSTRPSRSREIPFKPSRMIHFLDFSNEKMVAKVPDIAPTVDILLGNLEDADPGRHARRPRAPG